MKYPDLEGTCEDHRVEEVRPHHVGPQTHSRAEALLV